MQAQTKNNDKPFFGFNFKDGYKSIDTTTRTFTVFVKEDGDTIKIEEVHDKLDKINDAFVQVDTAINNLRNALLALGGLRGLKELEICNLGILWGGDDQKDGIVSEHVPPFRSI